MKPIPLIHPITLGPSWHVNAKPEDKPKIFLRMEITPERQAEIDVEHRERATIYKHLQALKTHPPTLDNNYCPDIEDVSQQNWIRQHIPNFVDIDGEPRKVEFNTVEELLDICWVKSWTNKPRFTRFSMSYGYFVKDNYSSQKPRFNIIPDHKLMVEYDDGYGWWVIGRLRHRGGVDLPAWAAKYHGNS